MVSLKVAFARDRDGKSSLAGRQLSRCIVGTLLRPA